MNINKQFQSNIKLVLTSYLGLFVLMLISISSQAQDTTFIKPYPNHISIENSVGRSGLGVFAKELNQERALYSTNNNFQFGYQFNWRFIGLSLGFNLPVFNNSEEKFGTTKGLNIRMDSQIKRKVLLNIFFIRQKGLFVANTRKLVTNHNGNPLIVENMITTYVGADINYLFNYNTYSYKAPFGINERQIKSAGSPIIGAFLFFNGILNHDSLIQGEAAAPFNTFGTLTHIRSFSTGLTIGYGHNWVIKKYGIIGLHSTAGMGFGLTQNIANNQKQGKVTFNTRFRFHAMGGYMADNISAGMRVSVNTLFVSANQNVRTAYILDNIKLFFSYRFKPKITRKKNKPKK